MSETSNPLLADWTAPYALPPFQTVKAAHFPQAFDVAMRAHLKELDEIASNPAPPNFENTAVAFDGCGRLLNRISLMFDNLTASETSPELQEIERDLAPLQAAHRNAIFLNAALFSRFQDLHAQLDSLALSGEGRRLVERIHRDFVRAGANLSGPARALYATHAETLASLCTQFGQNVLFDESAFVLPLDGPDDLLGLPASMIDVAVEAARARGLPAGSRVVTLSPSIAEPFLTFSARRDLRERLWRARVSRGAHDGAHDNRPVAARIIALRQQMATLLGYATYADFQVSDRMAGTPDAARALLERTWAPALHKAEEDRRALTEMAKQLGEPTPIAAWDWMYLAEKVRQANFDLDDAEVKAYFSLEKMIDAAFDCASRLFGIQFTERTDVPLYHSDARLWEVADREGKLIGIFIGDYFARQTKRSGAWMSVFRSQSGLNGGTLPIVINNNNFAKSSPSLLSFDDVTTLFHEFGHGLHGLLSNARYERLAGTNVPGDFVEFPSQIFENWAQDEQVLLRHATHWQTGAPIPAALLTRLTAARRFDQAFGTIQYVAPALIDMALHALPEGESIDIAAFERAQCRRLGVPDDIGLRHHLSHFQHLFAGDGYAAGYYVYMWADVLAADGFAAFTEAKDPFDRAVAARLHRDVYSSGGTIDPAAAYRAYRGRDPDVAPMLRQRGLLV
ncbi:M3 family metallopeptidase [Robbsia sp. KACC 23696]|uniref:M3 family metallopeptidase n=1 Tax=Robbsia sp. KACC 23696 TaxID=3149231 RepID=UPI00325B7D08